MSIHISNGLYVRIEELKGKFAPTPKPLENGFSTDFSYRVQGVADYSETSETYFMLINDNDEIWFISNRHLRYVFLRPDFLEARIPFRNEDESSDWTTDEYL